jgi:hypothetical protein
MAPYLQNIMPRVAAIFQTVENMKTAIDAAERFHDDSAIVIDVQPMRPSVNANASPTSQF